MRKNKTKKKTLFSLLAALLVGAGIGGHLSAPKTEVASADYIGMDYSGMTTNTTDHFLISGGTYSLAANTSNGIPLTVTPTQAGNDVTLVWNGAYRLASASGTNAVGVGSMGGNDVGFYSNGVNAKAMIHTFRSTLNPEICISLVCTPKQEGETNDSMWLTFTDKISFREDGVPYITGTNQTLVRWSTVYSNVMSTAGYYFFRIYDEQLAIQTHDSWGVLTMDDDWFTESTKYLPEEMKETFNRSTLLNAFDVEGMMDYCMYSMTFVGLEQATTQIIRWFETYKFYNMATDGSYTMPLPQKALIHAKYRTLVSGVSYTLDDLLTWQGNVGYPTVSDYPYFYAQMSELNNLYWATNGNGTNWSMPSNNYTFTFNNESFLNIQSTASEKFDTLYYIGYFANASQAGATPEFKGKLTFVDSGLISQKTTTLKAGQTYKLNDLFRWVDEDCNPFGNTKNYVSVDGYLSGEWGTGTAIDFGTFGVNTGTITPTQVGTYTITTKTTLDELNATEKVATTFTFTVEDEATGISEASLGKTTYKYGEALDLTGATVKVNYKNSEAQEIAITEDMITGYDANKLGTATLTVSYQDFTTTVDVTVEDYVTAIGNVVAGKTTYVIGEEFDPTGWSFTATMASGAMQSVDVTAAMISDFATTAAGDATLTVTYEGQTATADYTVTVAGMTIDGMNVALNESLTVKLYVTLESQWAGAKVKFTINGYEKTVDGVATGVANEYVYAFDGVAPQWIGDAITAEVVVNDETVLTKEISVLNYLNGLLGKTAVQLGLSEAKYAAMKTLIADICDYGAAAQVYTNYKTDALVNANVTGASTFEAVASGDQTLTGTALSMATFRGASVYFDGVNKLYFSINASDVTNVTIKVKIGSGEEKTITAADFVAKGDGVYGFYTDAIYATDFDTVVTATIYDGTTEGQTATFSVKSYVYNCQNEATADSTFVKAAYKYGVSAKAYAAL